MSELIAKMANALIVNYKSNLNSIQVNLATGSSIFPAQDH
jgi:hypothetical protein